MSLGCLDGPPKLGLSSGCCHFTGCFVHFLFYCNMLAGSDLVHSKVDIIVYIVRS